MSEHVEVIEGRARLRMPAGERGERGPGTKPRRGAGAEAPTPLPQVFYNPAMALNRDLSSLLLATRAQAGWTVLDGLAASGARGIRYALECGAPIQLEMNDWNPVAARLAEENAAANGVDATVTRRNLAALLQESVWNVVDVDPYGSPSPFLDGATRALRDHGILGVTATDATALAGVYPNVCRRRYLATPLHGELGHEVALRILAAAAVRQAAKHEIALRPILAHATDHYYRVVLAARRGASRADEALKEVGVAHYCPTCGDRGFSDGELCPACGAPVRSAGPLWKSALCDGVTMKEMLARAEVHPFARREEALALLRLLDEEARGPQVMYDIHDAGSRLRQGSPRTEVVLEALRAQGYRVGPVHFNRLAFRTDAPTKAVDAAMREASA